MKKVLLMIMILAFSVYGCGENTQGNLGNNGSSGTGGGSGGSDNGTGGEQELPWKSADFLIRYHYGNTDGSHYYIINNNGLILQNIAENINNKANIYPVNEKKIFITTNNELYVSTDGWNNFKKIFTTPEIEKYNAYSLSFSYALKGVMSLTTYQSLIKQEDGIPSNIYKYYESYDDGKTWKLLEENNPYISNSLVGYIVPNESGNYSEIIVKYTYNTSDGQTFYMITNAGTVIREIASDIKDKTGLTIKSDKLAFISTTNSIYRSTDGWNTFNKIYTAPDLENHNIGGTGLWSNLKNVISWCTFYTLKTPNINLPSLISRYYASADNGTTAREIASEIKDKTFITWTNEDTLFISTKKDVYRSRDGWYNFEKVFTAEEVDKYSTYIYMSYGLQGIVGLNISYSIKNYTEGLPIFFSRYYESYDYGNSWTQIGSDYTSGSYILSRPFFYNRN